jgi:RNA polymerase sporulation-specific sigma factor
MLSVTFALILHGLYMTLRLARERNGAFPHPLSAEEEHAALQEAAKGNRAARNLLVEHNLRLVAHVIKKYYFSESDQEDLISIGTVGLIKAVDTYRPDREVRLPTYACKCIQNEIFMHFRSQRRRAGEISLNEPIDTDKDGQALSIVDMLTSEYDQFEAVEREETARLLRSLVNDTLDLREHRIIMARYGLDGRPPRTQKEIAADMGISRSYVSRIEKRALELLEAAYRAQE